MSPALILVSKRTLRGLLSQCLIQRITRRFTWSLQASCSYASCSVVCMRTFSRLLFQENLTLLPQLVGKMKQKLLMEQISKGRFPPPPPRPKFTSLELSSIIWCCSDLLIGVIGSSDRVIVNSLQIQQHFETFLVVTLQWSAHGEQAD